MILVLIVVILINIIVIIITNQTILILVIIMIILVVIIMMIIIVVLIIITTIIVGANDCTPESRHLINHTPGLHNKIPAHKIFARVWVAQESFFPGSGSEETGILLWRLGVILTFKWVHIINIIYLGYFRRRISLHMINTYFHHSFNKRLFPAGPPG